ncbi:hypothetical protein Glove_198g37 [Diversispora epigaea]|uniref:Uncharacterized protein n=1 Tax=Diversispora epigaea TaxID=1348612 RepID=A0A397IUU6_9GLOM|nr:hypothetical protein Glove_198g37 [Diversispora epigaea]
MLLSITLTALSTVTASVIIPIFKYFELKEQKKHQKETANQYLDESNNEPNNEESNIESYDSQCNKLADTSVATFGVENESKNRNDDGDTTSTPEMLPPLLELVISSYLTEEERFNNLNDKIDEIFKRVEMMRNNHEQRHQKK